MKRTARFDGLLTTAAALALATVAIAQPPEGGPPQRGPGGPPHDPLRAALDADGDHELSADEIKNAAIAVAQLDRNGDGRIDHEEFRPPRPPRRGPPADGDEARRPPRDGAGPPRGARPEGRPPREFGGPRGERPAGGPRPGGPSPERFVARAMSFDADGDGKLDEAEMEKFAGEIQQRMRGGRGPGRPGGPPEGDERPEQPE
jgi:hypothetical protein